MNGDSHCLANLLRFPSFCSKASPSKAMHCTESSKLNSDFLMYGVGGIEWGEKWVTENIPLVFWRNSKYEKEWEKNNSAKFLLIELPGDSLISFT